MSGTPESGAPRVVRRTPLPYGSLMASFKVWQDLLIIHPEILPNQLAVTLGVQRILFVRYCLSVSICINRKKGTKGVPKLRIHAALPMMVCHRKYNLLVRSDKPKRRGQTSKRTTSALADSSTHCSDDST